MKLKILFITVFAAASLYGQGDVDPFNANAAKAPPVPPQENGPKNISICYETFSLPLAMAAKVQRTQLSDPDLYKYLVAAVEKGDARQESFTVLRARSGERATTQGISEQIYPTAYDPAQTPNSVTIGAVPSSVPDAENSDAASSLKSLDDIIRTPATPTAFETKNTGITVEIEPTLGADGIFIDLRLMPDHVTTVGKTTHGQGLSTTEMPIFESQRISTAATIRVNQPLLLGTVNRTPNSKVDPDSANRVWFAFVTGTLAKF